MRSRRSSTTFSFRLFARRQRSSSRSQFGSLTSGSALKDLDESLALSEEVVVCDHGDSVKAVIQRPQSPVLIVAPSF
jgi:hypothetical protein